MTVTRSFFDLLASKGWSPPAKPMNTVEAAAESSRPTMLKKKATSMLDLFAHGSPRPTRAKSCAANYASPAKNAAADPNHHQPEQESTRTPTKLKKCASVGAKTCGGWGMIPVLNELEQHSSFYHRSTRRRRASQCVCRNCGRLFFKHLSGVEADFCSLDCQASHAYTSDMQDAIDAQLEIGGFSDSLMSSDWSSASSYTSSSAVSFSSGS